jgi:hypothetical protein
MAMGSVCSELCAGDGDRCFQIRNTGAVLLAQSDGKCESTVGTLSLPDEGKQTGHATPAVDEPSLIQIHSMGPSRSLLQAFRPPTSTSPLPYSDPSTTLASYSFRRLVKPQTGGAGRDSSCACEEPSEQGSRRIHLRHTRTSLPFPSPASGPVPFLPSAARWRRRRLGLPRGPRRGWGCCTTGGCARTPRRTGRTTRRTPSACGPSGASSTPRASRPGTDSLVSRLRVASLPRRHGGIWRPLCAALASNRLGWGNTQRPFPLVAFLFVVDVAMFTGA